MKCLNTGRLNNPSSRPTELSDRNPGPALSYSEPKPWIKKEDAVRIIRSGKERYGNLIEIRINADYRGIKFDQEGEVRWLTAQEVEDLTGVNPLKLYSEEEIPF